VALGIPYVVVSYLSLIQDEVSSGIEKSGGRPGGGGMALDEEVWYPETDALDVQGSDLEFGGRRRG